MVEQIRAAVEDAQLVLVGIGEEFGSSEKEIMEKYPAVFADETLSEQALGYLVQACREQEEKEQSGKLHQAYLHLWELIQEKNYFCISANTDDFLYKTIEENGGQFRQDRIVSPCGGYRKLQCPGECTEVWAEPEEEWKNWARNYIQNVRKQGAETNMPKEQNCPKCGRPLVFNNVYAEHYKEQGYLEQWEVYRKWLEGTVNKKLCILELGAGMKFPTVIRWPFEKVTAYNRKAVMFRIHSSLYQFPDSVENRGISVSENPVDFFANKFV